MRETGPGGAYAAVRYAGSLWFAAVLLCLALVAMACATVYESLHGTERAAVHFYHSWWFTGLLALLGVNVLAAMAARYPFNRGQIGFVLTHGGIVVLLMGSLVSKHFGVDGQLGLAEGQSADYFSVPEDVLEIADVRGGKHAAVDLGDMGASRLTAATGLEWPVLALGDVTVEIDQYVPDSVIVERVADDAPHEHPAVLISLAASADEAPKWLFLNESVEIGPARATFRLIEDDETLARLVAEESPEASRSLGTIEVDYDQASFAIAVEDAVDQPVVLGDSGLSVRFLRYLPHATVTADNRLVNASPRPENPAIEVEFSGSDRVEKRVAFARFPDFQSMHAAPIIEGLVVRFIPSASPAPTAPVEVLTGTAGNTFVRFAWEGTKPVVHELVVGRPVESPWPGRRFTLVKRFERARKSRDVVPADQIRKERVPAVRVKVTASDESREFWLQRRQPQTVAFDDSRYDVAYGDKRIPLGFSVTLDRFRVGYYPGTRRPRSFESQISILDPRTGRAQARVVSMNHPTKYASYNFYQASYRIEGDRKVSFLSVARDPGLPIVFVGYVATLVGMLLVLARRMADHRGVPARQSVGGRVGSVEGNGRRTISLLDVESGCMNGTTNGGAPLDADEVSGAAAR